MLLHGDDFAASDIWIPLQRCRRARGPLENTGDHRLADSVGEIHSPFHQVAPPRFRLEHIVLPGGVLSNQGFVERIELVLARCDARGRGALLYFADQALFPLGQGHLEPP